jgi:hypothetical protein
MKNTHRPAVYVAASLLLMSVIGLQGEDLPNIYQDDFE